MATILIASHGGTDDVEMLNDLCNGLGGGVQRLHADGVTKGITAAEIRESLPTARFVLVGLCEYSSVVGTWVQRAERNLLLGAHEKKIRYGIFCRRIEYALSHHLYDAGDISMILTCEKPNAEQAAKLLRAFPKSGTPIEIRIPRTDAAKVTARMAEVLLDVAA